MLRSCEIPQAKRDWAGSIVGVKIPRESHVPQVLLTEPSPSPLHSAGMCAAVLGGSALQEMVPTSAIPKEPSLWKRKHIKLGVLFKFQEGELPSAFTGTHISFYQVHVNIILFLPQDHPGTRD